MSSLHQDLCRYPRYQIRQTRQSRNRESSAETSDLYRRTRYRIRRLQGGSVCFAARRNWLRSFLRRLRSGTMGSFLRPGRSTKAWTSSWFFHASRLQRSTHVPAKSFRKGPAAKTEAEYDGPAHAPIQRCRVRSHCQLLPDRDVVSGSPRSMVPQGECPCCGAGRTSADTQRHRSQSREIRAASVSQQETPLLCRISR